MVLANYFTLLSFTSSFVPSHLYISVFLVCIFATPDMTYAIILRAFCSMCVSQNFLQIGQITCRSNTILRNVSIVALLIHWPFSACCRLRLHKQPLTLWQHLVPFGGLGREAETYRKMQKKGSTVLCHVLAPLLQNEELPFEHSSGTDICSSLCSGVRGNATCGTKGSLFI